MLGVQVLPAVRKGFFEARALVNIGIAALVIGQLLRALSING